MSLDTLIEIEISLSLSLHISLGAQHACAHVHVLTHTHTHRDTHGTRVSERAGVARSLLLFIFLCTCGYDSVRACRGG